MGSGRVEDLDGQVIAGVDNVTGAPRTILTDTAGKLIISNPGSGGSGTSEANASVSATGAAVPASATFIAGVDSEGKERGLSVDAAGKLAITLAALPELPAGTKEIGKVSVSNFPGTQPISGTVTIIPSGTQTVAGTVTANAGSGTLKVDGSAVTQPISGTVTANAGTGTLKVEPTSLPELPAGTKEIGKVAVSSLPALPAGANAIGSVSVSNFPGTQPISGTVTANAGTNLNTSALALEAGHLATIDTSTARIPTQGQAAMAASTPVVIASNQSAVKVDGSAVTQPVSISGTQAVSLASLPALVAGSALIGGVSLYDSAGSNKATISAGGALKVDGSAATQPVSGTVTANAGSGTLAVSLASIPALAAGSNEIGKVAVSSLPALVAGTAEIGSVKQAGTWTVQPGNTANTTPWLVSIASTTSGGFSTATGSIGATVTAVKTSEGQVYGWYFYNSNTSVAYVQFFNTATGGVTLGTTAPILSLGIPAGAGANVFNGTGIPFSTAITIAVTTTRAGSTGPTNTVDYNLFYK